MSAQPRTVAEGFLAALADRGVEWVFGNAGTDFAPITEHGRLGSRNAPIHWGQEMFDQGGIVREFVKWDNELRAGEHVVDQVDRALAIAQAEPCGPVYLSLPREVLAESLPEGMALGLRGVAGFDGAVDPGRHGAEARCADDPDRTGPALFGHSGSVVSQRCDDHSDGVSVKWPQGTNLQASRCHRSS